MAASSTMAGVTDTFQARYEDIPDIEKNRLRVRQSITLAALDEYRGDLTKMIEHKLTRAAAELLVEKVKLTEEPHPLGVVHSLEAYIFSPGELRQLMQAMYDSGMRGQAIRRPLTPHDFE